MAAVFAVALTSTQARAVELMTTDGLLLALTRDEFSRKAANEFMEGTLETLIVLNEVTAGGQGQQDGQGQLFCLSDDRARLLDNQLLRENFADWLRDRPPGPGTSPGGAPVALLAWSFMAQKFPCAKGQPNANLDEGVKSKLLEAIPK